MRAKFAKTKYAGLIAGAILAGGFAPAAAEGPLAARNIRAGAILTAEDISPPKSDEALRRAAQLIGMEAARSIYQGQPIAASDLRQPTLIARNAVIHIEFVKGPLAIATEGRALDPGAEGERIRVMNLSSRRIVTGVVVSGSTVRMKQ